jgi:hypothetical protein
MQKRATGKLHFSPHAILHQRDDGGEDRAASDK